MCVLLSLLLVLDLVEEEVQLVIVLADKLRHDVFIQAGVFIVFLAIFFND